MTRHLIILCLLLSLIIAQPLYAQTPTMRVGINLAGIADWSTEYPFVDIFKTARAWISQREGAEWGEGGDLALTPEGWVASLDEGQYAETVMFSADSAFNAGMDGDYTILYEGEGTIAFRGSNVNILTEAAGQMLVNARPSEGAVFLQITATNPDNPLRNIQFLMSGSDPSQVFNPVFLEKISPFGVLRFMDWMNTNNSAITSWAERPQITDAVYELRGVPVEVMVQLANTLQADAWFNMPHTADDEYIREFATYVRDHLDPNLKAYIEYSNETWNGQFSQAAYVMEQGTALNLAGDDPFWSGLKFHAQRATEIFTIWEDVFGGTDRLVRVLAAQAANPWTGEQVAQEALGKADALAIAPYFSCDELSVAGFTVEQLLEQQLANVQEGGCAYQYMVDNLAVAEQFGLSMVAYEGGQHLVGYDNNEITTLFIEANRHPRMGEVYLEYLRAWRGLGGGTFMLFSDAGQPSQFGSWGLLENITQDTSPKYQAVITFIDELSQ